MRDIFPRHVPWQRTGDAEGRATISPVRRAPAVSPSMRGVAITSVSVWQDARWICLCAAGLQSVSPQDIVQALLPQASVARPRA